MAAISGPRTVAGAALLGLLALCAACRSVPTLPAPVAEQPSEFRLEVRNDSGSLSARQSRAVLTHIKESAPDGDSLARHLAAEQAVANSPLYTSNKVRLLRDGDETFPAMFAAIHAAQHHIHLEYFIFEDVECKGEHLGDLLIAQRQRGIEVAVIYDPVGSHATPASFFDRLKAGGIKVFEFHPINPLKAKGRYSLNDRDHRKLLVVDGSHAIIGGINMSHTYQSESPSGSSPSAGSGKNKGDPNEQYWHDTDLEITGPVVAELERLFLSRWAQQNVDDLGDGKYFPHVDAQGKDVVRIIGSVPAHSHSRYYMTLLAAIESADQTIWITTAYFVPTREEREQLADAARRGVDVRLMLPSKSDSKASLAVQHSTYGSLLKAGVKIYEQEDAILHSKTVVVDHVWSSVGSSNFDHRSVLYNDEVDAVVLGTAMGQILETQFNTDMQHAHSVSMDAWHHRSMGERFDEQFWGLAERLL
ncbi:MAG TPA: phospholipase D-like domain-containing protein [Steroidobacteraceae bacterium]